MSTWRQVLNVQLKVQVLQNYSSTARVQVQVPSTTLLIRRFEMWMWLAL